MILSTRKGSRIWVPVLALMTLGLLLPVQAATKEKAAKTESKPVAKAGDPRPPYPERGENLDKPIPPRNLAEGDKDKAGESAPKPKESQASDGQVIPWHEAHNHMGKKITVEGTVVVTRNTGKVCFLNFAKDWRGKFYVILFEDVLNSWPEAPEKYFMNKKIHVTGMVREHKGSPQIQVKEAGQIKLVEEPAASSTGPR